MMESDDMRYTLDDPRARALFFNLEDEVERLRKYVRTLEKENGTLRAALESEQGRHAQLKKRINESQ